MPASAPAIPVMAASTSLCGLGFAHLTPSGVGSDARRASPQKGEKLFALCGEGLANVLKDGRMWD